MRLTTKIIAGSSARKTRLHDQKGNLVPIGRLIRNGPRAALSGARRLIFGMRPAAPWISYDAVDELRTTLPTDCRVLEFGSGMSTIWYARHAGQVVAIEDNEGWYHLIKKQIEDAGNVDYRLAAGVDQYTQGIEGSFNLVVIDGSYRSECADVAIRHISDRGVIYLDNSDRGRPGSPGSDSDAENKLVAFAKERGWSIKYFVDFAPTQLFVQQGLMIRAPR